VLGVLGTHGFSCVGQVGLRFFLLCTSSANPISSKFYQVWQRAFSDYVLKMAAKMDEEEKASER
jgi:hypothetical protein